MTTLGERFVEYMEFTNTTAVYPGDTLGEEYVSLGVINEIGELAGKVKKMIRGDNPKHTLDCSSWRLELAKELGDVCWYYARILKQDIENGFYADHGSPLNVEELFNTVLLQTSEELNRTPSDVGLSRDTRALMDAVLSLDNTEIVRLLLQIAARLGYELSLVLSLNEDKLRQRLVNGTIKGDGDNR